MTLLGSSGGTERLGRIHTFTKKTGKNSNASIGKFFNYEKGGEPKNVTRIRERLKATKGLQIPDATQKRDAKKNGGGKAVIRVIVVMGNEQEYEGKTHVEC